MAEACSRFALSRASCLRLKVELRAAERTDKHPLLQRKGELEFLTIQKKAEPTRIFEGNPAQEGRVSNR